MRTRKLSQNRESSHHPNRPQSKPTVTEPKNQSSTRKKQIKETSSRVHRIGDGRVEFLARKDAIKEMVDAGYTTASIYRKLDSQLGIGYTQFNNYINKFIKDKRAVNKTKETPSENRTTEEKPKEEGSSERLYLRAWGDSNSLSDSELF